MGFVDFFFVFNTDHIRQLLLFVAVIGYLPTFHRLADTHAHTGSASCEVNLLYVNDAACPLRQLLQIGHTNQPLPFDFQRGLGLRCTACDDHIALTFNVKGSMVTVFHRNPHCLVHFRTGCTSGFHALHLLVRAHLAKYLQVIQIPQLGVHAVAAFYDDDGFRLNDAGFRINMAMGIKHTVAKQLTAAQIRHNLFLEAFVIHIATGGLQSLGGAEALGQEEIIHMNHRSIQLLLQKCRQGGLSRSSHTVNANDHRSFPLCLQCIHTLQNFFYFLCKQVFVHACPPKFSIGIL